MSTISNKKVLQYVQLQWYVAVMEEQRGELQPGSSGSSA